ncbi:PEP-CTERM sorting domain-containing protein [Rheinheimera sp. UJ63]|uniref:PEP-CTERM sorting domain-containing protein n=1 Tax=Rheinheimera sp. UJ63 TaxID=2910157 RepID=UPI001F329708|nr:PEP-CTERM sorting domain-containing protein [Rheinheimera sp. UJ63]MCF4010497.1 PEP-CTERM sorting domain-containing protein [Rheinheimera sp. UJ63]
MNFKSISKKFSLALTAMTLFGAVSTTSYAAPIIPTYDSFGYLNTEFGGDGIPNSFVAITNFRGFTLGLSSHGRYENLSEGNDGAGTFFASPGQNTPPSSSLAGATWNFNFYVSITDSSMLNDYVFNLFYDFDPAANNDQSTHGLINLSAFLAPNNLTAQGSQNLLFSFLSGSPTLPFITPPPSPFNPNANGEYTFALTASDAQGEVARSAIRVVVGTPNVAVPAPATALLLAGGLLLLRLRRRN